MALEDRNARLLCGKIQKMLTPFVQHFTKNFLTGVTKLKKKHYLVDDALKHLVQYEPKHIGIYLGTEGQKFIPSIALLQMIQEKTDEYIVLDDKSAWLFVCGRDIFPKSIKQESGTGKWKLVLNMQKEVLGVTVKERMYKNYFDIGNFLRRESK